ncbi:hypothetical protein AXG93_4142s1260 [Marchantia polymorpha subsp. ruderalis]|uniref:Uncharacterized protein n=1 Tax=Marchantia polymorpha subsp. ruderalis TaxID=1480154 RepID=A0A176WN20_MARPO|nr:hypothetical protein AXG93_4142s1260 [Marchantia polymorpha subsp. ruderalis]
MRDAGGQRNSLRASELCPRRPSSFGFLRGDSDDPILEPQLSFDSANLIPSTRRILCFRLRQNVQLELIRRSATSLSCCCLPHLSQSELHGGGIRLHPIPPSAVIQPPQHSEDSSVDQIILLARLDPATRARMRIPPCPASCSLRSGACEFPRVLRPARFEAANRASESVAAHPFPFSPRACRSEDIGARAVPSSGGASPLWGDVQHLKAAQASWMADMDLYPVSTTSPSCHAIQLFTHGPSSESPRLLDRR